MNGQLLLTEHSHAKMEMLRRIKEFTKAYKDHRMLFSLPYMANPQFPCIARGDLYH